MNACAAGLTLCEQPAAGWMTFVAAALCTLLLVYHYKALQVWLAGMAYLLCACAFLTFVLRVLRGLSSWGCCQTPPVCLKPRNIV
jgi:Ca2+/Na+ antiporter